MFSNILVGVDGQQGGRDAIALAKQLAANAEITLAHVYGAGLMPGRGAAILLARERQESTALLTRERDATCADAHLLACAARSPGSGLHDLAERGKADLIVVGSSRRGLLGRVLIGNDTTEAVNGAPCAVAIASSGMRRALMSS